MPRHDMPVRLTLHHIGIEIIGRESEHRPILTTTIIINNSNNIHKSYGPSNGNGARICRTDDTGNHGERWIKNLLMEWSTR